jgi:hypothetical protein
MLSQHSVISINSGYILKKEFNMTTDKKILTWATWAISIIMVSGLIMYCILGLYNRYWADDWCYNADYKTLGFWGILNGYNYITYYASNRISLTLFSVFLQNLGVLGVQLLPALLISSWGIGLYWNISSVFKLLNYHTERSLLITITTAIVYFSIYLAPNQFQSIYWRSAVLPYTAPLIGTLYIIGLILHKLNQSKENKSNKSFITYTLLFFMVLLTGLFSESGWAFLFCAICLIMIVTLGFSIKLSWTKQLTSYLIVAFVSSLVALLILVLCPANALRLTGYPARTALWLVPVLSTKFAIDFAFASVKGLLFPHIMLFLLFFSLSSLSEIKTVRTIKQLVLFCLGALIIALLFMAANQAPSVYIEKGPPHPRALIMSRFIWTITLAAIAFVIAGFYRIKNKRLYAFNLILLGFSLIYFGRTVILETKQWQIYSDRAMIWDNRDMKIRQAVLNGEKQITVQAIDGATMDNTRDFKERSTFWLNACAAHYYGIEEIFTTTP